MSIPTSWGSISDWMRMVARDLNPVVEGRPFKQLASDPADPTGGYTYYNTTTGKVRTYNGVTAAWADHY